MAARFWVPALEKASMSTGDNGRIATHRLVADSVDAYSAALPGFTLDIVRTGAGFGPNFARATVADDVMLASCVTDFPSSGERRWRMTALLSDS